MAWHHLRCSCGAWQRDYRHHTNNNLHHPQQGAVIMQARQIALQELLDSGQPHFAATTLADVASSNHVWNQGGNPGPNYRQF